MTPRKRAVLASVLLTAGCGGDNNVTMDGDDPSQTQVRRLEAACQAQPQPLVDCDCAVRLAAEELDEFGYEYFIDALKGNAVNAGLRAGDSSGSLSEAMRGLRTISSACAL